ncbi:MAG: hypothetical protein ACRESY_06495, partial [Steroidobacteraceae bacterium]
MVPSEQITVVPESGGTTTVVLLFCGAGGLLLLMQPDKAATAASEIRMTFMVTSSWFPDCGCSFSMRVS